MILLEIRVFWNYVTSYGLSQLGPRGCPFVRRVFSPVTASEPFRAEVHGHECGVHGAAPQYGDVGRV